MARHGAVRLFVERARAVVPGFALTEENSSALARVCRALDGMPLAIELAAARVKVLSVEQISEELEDPLGLLTTGSRSAAPRHRALRATLEWSHDLLSDEEKTLFRRLSVFVGGWTLEAAEAVGRGGAGGGVLDPLSKLVDKSLVAAEADAGGAPRYGFLEPVRQYGLERLEESGEEAEVRRRHAEHYLAFAETVEPELMGIGQPEWLRRLRAEFGNLRGAFSWSVECGEVGEGLRLAAALWRFWGAEGFEEGKRWLRTALEKDPGGSPSIRAKALGGLGFILLFQQDYERAIVVLEEAISLNKGLRDSSGVAISLGNLGYAVLHGGFHERVPAFVREAEALMAGDLDGHARAFLGAAVACAAIEADDLDSAVFRLEESLALCRELGDLRQTSMSLFILGIAELTRGDLDRGVSLLEEGARIAWELGDRLGSIYFAEGLAKVAALRGEPVRAATLWGAAEALREQMGVSLSRFDLAASGYERDLTSARSTLGEASFDAAWNEGRTMSHEEAIAYALDEPTTREEDAPSAEVAALRIFAFGSARVEKDGDPLDSPDWIQKPRELLYYLLSHPARTKEQIGVVLWPEASTAQLRGSFHDTVYRLRRALGDKKWIVFEKGRYTFDRSLDYFFDVEAFEENISEARRLQIEAPERAIRHLQNAADLYAGDFLEDTADGEWEMARQEELRRAYHEALLLLGRLLFAENRHAESADAYRKAIAHDALLEEAHRGLMRCHAASGERGRAIRHYEELVALLDEKLGASPAPETVALHERLRTGEEIQPG